MATANTPQERRRFNITLGLNARECTVAMDGVDITYAVKGITVRARVKEVTTVTLELIPRAVEIYGMAHVEIVGLMPPECNDHE